MLERDTTFIIGAGGSFDLGFPLGDTLRNRIVEILAVDNSDSLNFRDPIITRIIQDRATREAGTSAWPQRMDAYLQAAATIRAGLPFARSIDTFIDGLRHLENIEFLSKLAISAVILRSEAVSPLVHRPVHAANAKQIYAERLKLLLASWHTELSQILYDGHSPETLARVFEHASFVVFNYDRCLEAFLTISLMRRFGLSRDRALSLVGTCSIVHPYGQVGDFLPTEEGHVPFGSCEAYHLVPVASGIRTFTEAMEGDTKDQIKDLISQADVLVFMGFGWLPQNMELLQADGRLTNAQQVFATVMHVHPGEVPVIRDHVDKILRRGRHTPEYVDDPLLATTPEFITERGDCKALMNNCWLRLTRR